MHPDSTTKRCTKCGDVKPLSEFAPRAERPGQYNSHCIVCRKAWHKEYARQKRKTQPPRQHVDPLPFRVCKHCGIEKGVSEYSRLAASPDGLRPWCKSCIAEYNRWYRETYPDKVKTASRRWIANNTERYKATKKKNQEANKETRRRQRQAKYSANRQYYIDRAKAYAKTPRGIIRTRIAANKRRALEMSGDLTIEQVQGLMERQKRCAYCKNPFTKQRPATLDHVVPLSKGGAHTLSNIVLACKSCNSSKYNREIYLL